MATRWGLGPVFQFESLIAARRWQVYAGRVFFLAILLGSLTAVWWSEVAGKSLPTIRAQAAVGQDFYMAIIGTQLVLVLLAAPAATAGSICMDRARGTLAHLLLTDLSDGEIVLGKLASRLLPVLALVACAQPLMALGTLLGGIDPVALGGALLVTVGAAVLGCSLALLLSVWGRKTHEVLMVTYSILAFWSLGAPTCLALRMMGVITWKLPDWIAESNPFRLVLANHWWPGTVGLGDDALFLAVASGVSAALVAVAILRIRAVAARQDGRVERRGRGMYRRNLRRLLAIIPSPPLDANPVLWREWHRGRSSRWSQVVWTLYVVTAVSVSLVLIRFTLGVNNRMQCELGTLLNGAQVALGFLLLSVVSATSLAEERVRGSLDVILATPLRTRQIVMGKWWGAYRGVLALAVLPGLVSLAYARLTEHYLVVPLIVGYILAFGAALTSLGLALATWVSRLERAVALTVSAYILVTIGWLFLAGILFSGPGVDGPGIASASPFLATFFPLLTIQRTSAGEWETCVLYLLGWIVFYGAVAVILLVATLATFDREMGRVSSSSLGRSTPSGPNWPFRRSRSAMTGENPLEERFCSGS